jgi:hypothetical protein
MKNNNKLNKFTSGLKKYQENMLIVKSVVIPNIFLLVI